MKALLVLLTLAVSLNASAAGKKKKPAAKTDARTRICKSLIAAAEASCEQAMCEDQNEGQNEATECEHDGDFMEGMQICVYDGELPDGIKEWNKKHKFQIKDCDDVE